MNTDVDFATTVRAHATRELLTERFRLAVEQEKAQLRAHRSLWDRLFPFIITITRKK